MFAGELVPVVGQVQLDAVGQAGLVLPVLVPVVDADDPVPYTVDGLGTGADDAGAEVPLPVLRGMRGSVGLVLPEVVYLLGDPALDVPPVAVPGRVGVGERVVVAVNVAGDGRLVDTVRHRVDRGEPPRRDRVVPVA